MREAIRLGDHHGGAALWDKTDRPGTGQLAKLISPSPGCIDHDAGRDTAFSGLHVPPITVAGQRLDPCIGDQLAIAGFELTQIPLVQGRDVDILSACIQHASRGIALSQQGLVLTQPGRIQQCDLCFQRGDRDQRLKRVPLIGSGDHQNLTW